MANIRLTDIVLTDRWPGVPNNQIGIPTDGWDNTIDNFKSTAATDTIPHPLGEKRMVYTDNTEASGWYTMMYLQVCDASNLTTDVSADLSQSNIFYAHNDTTECVGVGAESRAPYYVVGRCSTDIVNDATKGSPLAVRCCSVQNDGSTGDTNQYGDGYGWFWIGGVCPCKDATQLQGLAGSLAGADITVGILERGPFMIDATLLLVTPDMSNTGDATAVQTGRDAAALIQGWACVSAD